MAQCRRSSTSFLAPCFSRSCSFRGHPRQRCVPAGSAPGSGPLRPAAFSRSRRDTRPRRASASAFAAPACGSAARRLRPWFPDRLRSSNSAKASGMSRVATPLMVSRTSVVPRPAFAGGRSRNGIHDADVAELLRQDQPDVGLVLVLALHPLFVLIGVEVAGVWIDGFEQPVHRAQRDALHVGLFHVIALDAREDLGVNREMPVSVFRGMRSCRASRRRGAQKPGKWTSKRRKT